MERMISLSNPKARLSLQSLWKSLRSFLLTAASTSLSGGNSERADELTKALLHQIFKQFDLPSLLRRRADKLRRRVGGSSASSGNSTEFESVKNKNDGFRPVDFRKKTDDSNNDSIAMNEMNKKVGTGGTNGDQQIRKWLGMVAEKEKTLAQVETIKVHSDSRSSGANTESTTTARPSSTASTRYPAMQLSLFQRRKGPVRVAVKLPQKHAKDGVKRFQPAQGRDLIDK
ncbi:hypothetical protein BIW11_06787 [Tropilaelaps mercedesae]|uniref:Uncharacterized protein n=1 Tax=Tropilaelaps mercedesae TaxID=418985 RepID=A0A1V9XWX9_9ACAR|nr:hypothetical protein BIW11_06787 [Tropilaelaps mercedesae]